MKRRRAHIPSPTLSTREVLRAIGRPAGVDEAERAIERITGAAHAIAFASARGGLAAAIHVLASGGRVGVPGYTCVAVPFAVESEGASPVYADVDARGLVPRDGWPAADVLLAQDTYGFESILPESPLVVCDSTHRADLVLRTGRGAVRVTSFEHSKTLSAGQGGLAVTDDADVAAGMRAWRDEQPPMDRSLGHAIITLLMMWLGQVELRGWRLAALALKLPLRLLAPARMGVRSSAERAGTDAHLGRPSRICARMMISQLARLPEIVEQRKRVVARYDHAAGLSREPEPLVRYPMLVQDPAAFEEAMRAGGWIVSGRWFATPLHPIAVDDGAFSFPARGIAMGRRLAAHVVNLPTHPRIAAVDADALIALALAAGAVPLAP
jgi:dTDP-4-amino-4,6-dideoxygalactose transaminase